jgi:predicted HTH transcriptional regulator
VSAYAEAALLSRVAALLEGGENERVEFKEGARVNRYTGTPEDTVKRAFLPAVAGMWNGSGGTVVIGVSDDGLVF